MTDVKGRCYVLVHNFMNIFTNDNGNGNNNNSDNDNANGNGDGILQ